MSWPEQSHLDCLHTEARISRHFLPNFYIVVVHNDIGVQYFHDYYNEEVKDLDTGQSVRGRSPGVGLLL